MTEPTNPGTTVRVQAIESELERARHAEDRLESKFISWRKGVVAVGSAAGLVWAVMVFLLNGQQRQVDLVRDELRALRTEVNTKDSKSTEKLERLEAKTQTRFDQLGVKLDGLGVQLNQVNVTLAKGVRR